MEIDVLPGLAFLGLEVAPGTMKTGFCSKNAARISLDRRIWMAIKPFGDNFCFQKTIMLIRRRGYIECEGVLVTGGQF